MDRIDKLLEEFDFEDFEPLMTSGNKMQLFPTEDAQSIKNILSAPSTVEPEIFDNSRPGDIGPHLEQVPAPAPSIEQAPVPSTPDSSRSLKKALTTAGGLGGIGLAAHYHDKKNK